MSDTEMRLPSDKLIVFRFEGGPIDGEESRSDHPVTRPNMNDAECLWFLTHMGRVGSQFKGLSPHALNTLKAEGLKTALEQGGPHRKHRYEIVNRQETTTEIILTCDYKAVD